MGGKKKIFHWQSILEILSLQEMQLRGEYNSNLSNNEGNGDILTVSKCKLEHPLKLLPCNFQTSA